MQQGMRDGTWGSPCSSAAILEWVSGINETGSDSASFGGRCTAWVVELFLVRFAAAGLRNRLARLKHPEPWVRISVGRGGNVDDGITTCSWCSWVASLDTKQNCFHVKGERPGSVRRLTMSAGSASSCSWEMLVVTTLTLKRGFASNALRCIRTWLRVRTGRGSLQHEHGGTTYVLRPQSLPGTDVLRSVWQSTPGIRAVIAG
jgi:hypothetical protein